MCTTGDCYNQAIIIISRQQAVITIHGQQISNCNNTWVANGQKLQYSGNKQAIATIHGKHYNMQATNRPLLQYVDNIQLVQYADNH